MRRAEPVLIGRTVAGKFLIEAHIGSGAMGNVYRAQHLSLQKTIALKVLHAELASDETFAARFQREALAASRLDHPCSMRVLDFGVESDGMLYIAMEYLDGRDLLRVMATEGPLSQARVVDILVQTLSALQVAHELGIIHRDLKPENIMILDGHDDDGRRVDVVKVCDFGIAKLTQRGADSAPTTTAGTVVGTPEYMSPEQGRGAALDARSDLYSVGVILFQLLTSQLPFTGENVLGVLYRQVNDPPPLPSSIRPDVDRALEGICMRALEKSPAARFQTAREMRNALRATHPGPVPSSWPSAATLPAESRAVLESMDTGAVQASAATLTEDLRRTSSVATSVGSLPVTPVRSIALWIGVVCVCVGGFAAAVAHFARTDASEAPAAAESSPLPSSVPQPSAEPAAESSAEPAAESSAEPGVESASSAAKAGKPRRVGAVAATAGTSHPAPPTSFSLTTSVASPTVTRASGVSPQDVRAAIPSFQMTECYRNAMKRSGQRLAGHVRFDLTLSGGIIKMVKVLGPQPIIDNAAACLTDVLTGLPVHDVPAGGGTATVDLECIPE